MKKVRITVMRKACYEDLMAKYENPMEDACAMEEGQVFIANGWQRPEGLCESAWETLYWFDVLVFYPRCDRLRYEIDPSDRILGG